jgi:hypothetical protein
MRVLWLAAALTGFGVAPPPPAASAGSATPAQPARDMPAIDPTRGGANCPETPMSLARKQAERPQAIPLNKLPPALVFMAVDRRIAGCPAPLTMIDYRNPHRR